MRPEERGERGLRSFRKVVGLGRGTAPTESRADKRKELFQ